MKATDNDHLITKRQAATRLAISPRTLDRWIADGRISAVRYSTQLVRIWKSEVQRIIDESS